ncbi:MAG: metallophosphoesterase [Bacteroidales bacterium]|nr:metallophosphoesterase [Bacteroidales bacterium]
MKIPFTLIIVLTLTACEVADIPGMFISYESVNQRFEQSMEWNAMHPYREIVVPSDDYLILSMGDSHVGGTMNLDTLLSRAITSNASAVVMVGDLTTGHVEDYAVFDQHLPDQDSLPSFLIAGNHDLYFNGWEEFYSRFGSSTFFFTIRTPVATDLYICLDTGGGTLGNMQLDWFKEILESVRPDHRRCVVFTHNNLFRFRRTTTTNPPVEELVVLLELFSEHQVDMVITGHDHFHYTQRFGSTWHIVMDALKDGLSNAGYFQLNLKNGDISFRFVNFN